MKTLFVYLSATLLLASIQANAQKQILKAAIDKISSYKSISYLETDRQKSPFTDDWSTLKFKATAIRNSQPDSVELFDYYDYRGYRKVYNGNMVITLNINDKTYESRKLSGKTYYATPYRWVRYIKEMLDLPASQLKIMPDTVINQIQCFHVKRVVANLPEDKNIADLYLNKKTCLPILIRELLQGKMGKGGDVDNKVTTLINEYAYHDYSINVKGVSIAQFKVPANYDTEKKVAMITPGNKAPEWTLQSSGGTTVSGKQFLGKVVLLDFSFNECAACMLSILY